MKKRIGIGAAIFLMMGGIVFFPPSFLKVQEVVVLSPPKHLSEFDLLRLSGVKKGDNLIRLRLSSVRSRVMRYPWIREVSLSKRFPGRLLIGVEEEVPVALLKLDSPYLVNGEGRIFKKAEEGDPKDLTIIIGSELRDLKPDELGRHVRSLVDLLQSFQRTDPLSRVGISEIHWEEGGSVSLYTREPRVKVEMGVQGWGEKTDRLARSWEMIRTTSRNPKGIDLQFEKKIIVKQGGEFDG